MFQGFIDEGVAGTLIVQIKDDGEPVEPDASPTWRLYGANGIVANGSGNATPFESGNVSNATNASPIVITSTNHGLTTGQAVTVLNVGGNTAANGDFTITKVNADSFSLDGSTGNGSYTSGGTWRTTGLYGITLSGSVLSSLAAGSTYTIVMNYEISSVAKAETITFTVR